MRNRTTPGIVGISVFYLSIQTSHARFAQCSASISAILQPYVGFGVCLPPVDDSNDVASKLSGWSPWTHRPQCVLVPKELSKKYCAFTNSRHGFRGISILTTPETAADCMPGILDEAVISTRNESMMPYKIVDIPGKGKGVIATRHISQYEEFMLDYATFAVDISFASRVPARTGHGLLHLAAMQLADPASVLELGQSNNLAADAL
ncbi:hypothetical protein B0T22DRAFT_481276 [Podospora appendiculata]|uniref:Uncharacterized protein n=1 Tax=Podospora appendiculata TaxID=314037 RepID=A0AAE0XCF2_9PEZI|nr:hypothetical protein B0T22DRAFT_481276 [Podospora appendiculata]